MGFSTYKCIAKKMLKKKDAKTSNFQKRSSIKCQAEILNMEETNDC